MANVKPTAVEVKSEEIQSAPVPVSLERKTMTNWRVFEGLNLIPTRITCNGYRGNHPSDLSCHSNLPLNVETILRHLDPQHGGGWFFWRLRVSDGKKWEGWRQLEEAGVELVDFHCPHCRAQIPVVGRQIMQHLAQHAGANRVNINPQTLCMTLGYGSPDENEKYLDEMYQ